MSSSFSDLSFIFLIIYSNSGFLKLTFWFQTIGFHIYDDRITIKTTNGLKYVKKKLNIGELAEILEGEIVCGEDKIDVVVEDYAAADLLSDLLALEKEKYALLTGLTNPQIFRTAEITNACCVVIVRGKQPQPAAVSVAKNSGIPLILCQLTMFEACARLGRHLEDAD